MILAVADGRGEGEQFLIQPVIAFNEVGVGEMKWVSQQDRGEHDFPAASSARKREREELMRRWHAEK